jgi:hypothetical protein
MVSKQAVTTNDFVIIIYTHFYFLISDKAAFQQVKKRRHIFHGYIENNTIIAMLVAYAG